jgi:hypothetical protein
MANATLPSRAMRPSKPSSWLQLQAARGRDRAHGPAGVDPAAAARRARVRVCPGVRGRHQRTRNRSRSRRVWIGCLSQRTAIVEDVATDHRFALANGLLLGFGLRACWSVQPQPTCRQPQDVGPTPAYIGCLIGSARLTPIQGPPQSQSVLGRAAAATRRSSRAGVLGSEK